MPHFVSKTILAKDIIGWAEELAAVEEARLSLASLGRTFYNMAVAEIQNLLGYVDVESLMMSATIDVTSPTGKYKSVDISADSDLNSYDKIINLELMNGASTTLIQIQTFPLPIKEFLRHKSNMTSGAYSGAVHPYEESAIYTLYGSKLDVLWGKDTASIATPTCTVYFTRQFTLLTTTNWGSAYMDVPDKYAPLLANRIAAYAEMRQGITDKAMAVVQNSYNQMMLPLDSQIKSKLMDSFQFKPIFTPNEQTNNEVRR